MKKYLNKSGHLLCLTLDGQDIIAGVGDTFGFDNSKNNSHFADLLKNGKVEEAKEVKKDKE